MYNLNVDVYDQWVDPKIVEREYHIEVKSELSSCKYDAIILAVAHDEFKDLDIPILLKENSVIFDVKSFLPREIVDGRL